VADITPASFDFTVDEGEGASDTLNVGNTGGSDLVWSIDEAETELGGGEFSEDFDSYAAGSQIHGVNGWLGWGNDPAAGALVSDAEASSAPNSLEIVGASDIIQEFSGVNSGQWTVKAKQFVPSDATGLTYFIALNTYDHACTTCNWSVQVSMAADAGLVLNEGAAGGSATLVKGEWVDLQLDIDFATDTQTFFYNGTELYTGSWTNGVSGGGALNFAVLDLFANNASSVYYDDVEVIEGGGPQPTGCDNPSDVSWLSASPTSGTTPAGGNVEVAVTVDSTGLAAGSYEALLCVTTNDPDAELVEVPVSLTVVSTGPVPVITTDPASFEFTVPAGGGDADALEIGNIGEADLVWSIDTTETLGRTPVSPLGDIVVFDDINFTVPANITGGSVQWTTGDTCECDTAPFNFNIWTTGGNASFFWPTVSGAQGGGVSLDGGVTYGVLEPGAT